MWALVNDGTTYTPTATAIDDKDRYFWCPHLHLDLGGIEYI